MRNFTIGSPEEKERHRKRMARKKKEKIKKVIKVKKNVVQDKNGKEHDLNTMTHSQLVKLI